METPEVGKTLVYGLLELILWKWLSYQKQSTDSTNSTSKTSTQFFAEITKNNLKIHLKNTEDRGKTKQSWTIMWEESPPLIQSNTGEKNWEALILTGTQFVTEVWNTHWKTKTNSKNINKKQYLQQMVLATWITDLRWTRLLSFTIHKSQLQMYQGPQLKA